ncbi:Triacylglycerol lipase [Mycobacterium attenuatum]|uniref:Triacylglycerol lipase n=1 Tax=Mycobacterium attenuatum TaxID=2341086 RepID=A0A498Q009_9MYCO|nr:Triacylglycerol lipase [Mycobacterium attenuatum]
MSYVMVTPEMVSAAAGELTTMGSSIDVARAAAAAQTSGIMAAGTDEVSAAIATLFSAHGQAFQTVSAQAAAFHNQFVQALNSGAGAYAAADAASVSPCRPLRNRSSMPSMRRPSICWGGR